MNVNIHLISKTVTPLTHMKGSTGNEALINKEPVVYNGKVLFVPVISGNALRHRLIREPGAYYLVDKLELGGKLNQAQVNFLFYGGCLAESTNGIHARKITEMHELFPFMRLLGGALMNQVLAGSIIVKRGTLFCAENEERIRQQLPIDYELEGPLKAAESLIGDYQYTRGDAKRRKDAGQLMDNIDDKETNLMLYAGQSIMPGALFYHGFICNRVSELELGALWRAVQDWEKNGSAIGGQARIGHGVLQSSILGDMPDRHKWIDMYESHVESHKKECIEWLNESFRKKTRGKK
jgi:hypothetical protein